MNDLEHLEKIIEENVTGFLNNNQCLSIRDLAVEIINAGYERTVFVEGTKEQ